MAAAFSHVIFDLDGTILNTLEDLAAAGNHTCEAHGWPTFAVDEYRYKVGNGMLKLVERFMPAEYAGDGRMFEQTLAEFRAYYGEHKEDHTAPYAGTIEMLDRLRAAGVQLAVLTNKDHISAAPLIEKYFGSERFALVQGRVDAFPPKPEAPVTLHVMEELGADPATTLYVGDSNVDILTGHNAGLKSAGVSWGFRGRAELEAAGADYVVDTQAELAALVLYWASNRPSLPRAVNVGRDSFSCPRTKEMSPTASRKGTPPTATFPMTTPAMAASQVEDGQRKRP